MEMTDQQQAERNAYVTLHTFLANALDDGRQAEQKAQIILAAIGSLPNEKLGKFLDLCEDWFACRH
jgi:hypothetical protein